MIEENAYLEKYSTLKKWTHEIWFQCYSNVTISMFFSDNTYLLCIYLVQIIILIPRCIAKVFQDDISSKTIVLWLHYPVPGSGEVCREERRVLAAPDHGAGEGMQRNIPKVTKNMEIFIIGAKGGGQWA